MPTILFICTANQIRSVIAEAAFKRELESRGLSAQWSVGSAGTWAEDGAPIFERIQAYARKHNLPGVDVHKSRSAKRELVEPANLVIVMEKGQKEGLSAEFGFAAQRIRLLTEFAPGPNYDIPDPGTGQAGFEEVADEIRGIIRQGFDKILVAASQNGGSFKSE